MGKSTIFLVDPMSYSNLGLYDKLLLENIPEKNRFLFGNVKYEHLSNTEFQLRLIYKYTDKKGVLKFISYFKSQLILLYSILKYNPEVVHFQWLKVPVVDFILLCLIKTLKKNTKVIFTAHNVLPHNSEESFKNIYGKIYRKVDKIIVHDKTTKFELLKLFSISENKVKVIPHGLLNIAGIDEEIKIEKPILTFAMLGYLSKYKGVDMLIDAWMGSDYLLNNNSVELVIAGTPKKEVLEDLKKIADVPNIRLLDKYLDSDDFNDLLLKSDVLVLPYKEISQSGVLLSGLKYKKTFIVSNVGGLSQPFDLGKVGWVLESNTTDCLRDRLEYVCRNKNEVVEIKNNNKLWDSIDEFYSWKKIGLDTVKLYCN